LGKTKELDPQLLRKKATSVDYIDMTQYFPKISMTVIKQIVNRMSDKSLMDHFKAVAKHSPKKRSRLRNERMRSVHQAF
jgi:hypothetical protein